jgi:ABC-2 type transport system ATP-binding protein
MTSVIETRGLTKTYGSVRALDGLSLSIPRGGVYGVLGPNGAGKSTLFRILLGLIRPTAGDASVMGGVVGDVASSRRMGSMIETPRFPPFMTARQVLEWLSAAHGLTADAARVSGWLERVGLAEAADRKVRGFSVGMLQRLGVAAALITEPELVILDEPTSGMDPVGARQIKDLIATLATRGKTVLLCSHLLADVEDLCDRVAIMYGGKVRAEGSCDDLLAREHATVLEVPELPESVVGEIRDLLRRHGMPLTKVERPRRSLENLFMEIVDQARAEGVQTSGARSGGAVAEFLARPESGDDHSDEPAGDGTAPVDAGLLDSLTKR